MPKIREGKLDDDSKWRRGDKFRIIAVNHKFQPIPHFSAPEVGQIYEVVWFEGRPRLDLTSGYTTYRPYTLNGFTLELVT